MSSTVVTSVTTIYHPVKTDQPLLRVDWEGTVAPEVGDLSVKAVALAVYDHHSKMSKLLGDLNEQQTALKQKVDHLAHDLEALRTDFEALRSQREKKHVEPSDELE